jgi:hypothetical protein
MKRLMLLCASLLLVACGPGQESAPDGGTTPPPAPAPVTLNVFGEFERDPNSPNTASLPGWYPVSGCSWIDGARSAEGYAGTSGVALTNPECVLDSVKAALPSGMTRVTASAYFDIWGRGCPDACVEMSLRWYASGVMIQQAVLGLPYSPGWKLAAMKDMPIPQNATHVQVRFHLRGQGVYIDRVSVVAHARPSSEP